MSSLSTKLPGLAAYRAPTRLPPPLPVPLLLPPLSPLRRTSYPAHGILRTTRSATARHLLLRVNSSAPVAPFSHIVRRHTATYSTMSPRGKKRSSAAAAAVAASAAAAATAAEEEAPSPKHHNITDPPKKEIKVPRRSSRRTNPPRGIKTNPEKGAGLIPNVGHLQEMKEQGLSRKESAEKAEAQEKGAEHGVAHAMQSLEEMELNFARDVKRRKIQVEQSIVKELTDPTHPPLKTLTSGESRALRVDRILLTPDKEDEKDEAMEDWEPRVMEVEGDASNEEDPEPAERGAKRPPAVNSDVLPLPWKGRLGYACLNTYLRSAKPPVFSSRTCRIASILEHRHPLANPSQPEHPTKNRPDKNQRADIVLGQKYVEGLGLANARDIVKMLQWNDKFGIKFMRLSSEMFPFASHDQYGYKLEPFAADVLAEAGRVAAELGHRLTTHPGQFTQLGSPRKEVVRNAIRDLEYHNELLSLLKLPPQQDRDAIMILHMGGTFNEAGGKPATLDRFRQNYATLSEPIKRRLVLENDDVSWSVHDLLPICEELNIPLVLDYHHHNIVFEADKCREGTYDISQPGISARITATWTRKGIKQKMHYSEPCAGAVTPRDRRKHSPRVATLPPCPPDADLMIEAKDKEQAVFELMRTFKLPGYEKIVDMVAHERDDQNRAAVPVKKAKKASPKKRKAKGASKKGGEENDEDADERKDGEEDDLTKQEEASAATALPALEVTAEQFGMGGPLGRVYWPVGFEEWLTPKKKERKVKAAGVAAAEG